MKILKSLIEDVGEEIDGAKTYIKQAIALKSQGYESEANTLLSVASDEITHAGDKLHSVIVSLIGKKSAEMKSKGIEIPEYMKIIWNEEHVEMIDEVAEARHALEMAKS